MKDFRRSSRVPRRSAENIQPESSSKRSRRSKAAETPTIMTRRRSRSNISDSRSPAPKGSTLSAEEMPPSPEVFYPKCASSDKDLYCWLCHTPTDESYCSSCQRVYHNECRRKISSSESLVCECSFKTVDGSQERYRFHPNALKELLCNIMEQYTSKDPKNSPKKQQLEVKKYEKYFLSWPEIPENERLCNKIDLNYIIDKIYNEPTFLDIGDFFVHYKWIYHNAFIAYGADSEPAHLALQIERSIRHELMDVEACGECHERMHLQQHVPSDFFATICERPHEIVWAKLRGSPFWPAKLLRIRKNGHADVRFFGTHDKSLMPSSQLLKFSKEYPAKKEISKSKFKDAMAEVHLYIGNFEKIYGKFKFYPKNTPYFENSKSPVRKLHKRKRSIPRTNQSEDSSNSFCEHETSSPKCEANENDEGSCQEGKENDKGICQEGKGSPRKQMIKPSLNISVLHEESASDVRCHMTYHIDEENGASELNTSDDFIGEIAKPECNQHTTVYPVASSANSGFMNHIEDRNHSSNTLPVITSTISSHHPEESTNVIPPPSVVFSEEYSHMTSLNPADSNQENSVVTANVLTELLRSTVPQMDDEEVQLVEETRGKNPLTESLTKSPSRVNALWDLLLLSKPLVKECMSKIVETTKRDFLMMWLEANGSNLHQELLKGFQIIYEKCIREIKGLHKIIEGLRKENHELNEKSKVMQTRIDLKNLLKDQLISNAVNQQKQKMQRDFEEKTKRYTAENEILVSELKKKQEEINLMSKEMAELKAELEKQRKINEADKKILVDVQCQTDVLCIFPDRNQRPPAPPSLPPNNDYINEQKQLFLQYQRCVFEPPAGLGLRGSFYAESSKFSSLEQVPIHPGFNPSIMGQEIVSSNIVSPNIVSPNIVPPNMVPSHSNSTILRNTIPAFPRLPSPSRSNNKFSAHGSYSPAKSGRKRHK